MQRVYSFRETTIKYRFLSLGRGVFFEKQRLTNIEFEIEVGIIMSDILVVIDFFNIS